MTQGRFSRRVLLKALLGGVAGSVIACSDEPDKPSTSPTAGFTLPPEDTQRPTSPVSISTLTPVPSPTVEPTPAATLQEKISQMIMVGFEGQTTQSMGPLRNALASGSAGNVVYFARNVAGPQQLASLSAGLQELAASRLLVAADQEGGYVARLTAEQGFSPTVTAQYLGGQPLDVTREYAASMAADLRNAGINLNLAPVLDLNVNPTNPAIGEYERSFSADPNVVVEHALAFIQAHHDEGVLCTLKHFPGHGSSTADSHLGFVDVTQTWTEQELIPFRGVIEAGQADAVMTAHIFNSQIDETYPGTLSHATITGLLRERLGYDGVVITDDMQMGAIREFFGFDEAVELAVLAGADVIAVANMLVYNAEAASAIAGALTRAVEAGRITEERIDESYRRIMSLKARLS